MNAVRRVVLGVAVMVLAPTLHVFWMSAVQMLMGALLLGLGVWEIKNGKGKK